MLPKDLQKLVEDTVVASKLDVTEADDLRRELTAHCDDQLEDLITQGIAESKAIPYIIKQFGETATIGEALYMVHQRYERIPLIGPILYYAPFCQAVNMFFQHCILLSVVFWLMIKPISIAHTRMIVITVFCCIALVQGVWLYVRCTDRVETLLLSYIPFFIFIITFQTNELAKDYFLQLPPSEFNFIRGLVLLIVIVIHCTSVTIGSIGGLLLRKFKFL